MIPKQISFINKRNILRGVKNNDIVRSSTNEVQGRLSLNEINMVAVVVVKVTTKETPLLVY